MSFIGEAALSVFLDLLMGKLVESALEFVADHKQVRQQLEQWQSILPGIRSVLNDAEQKQIKGEGEGEGVKKWLDDLQDLAYDMDDILDEFAYDVELRNTQAQARPSKVRRLMTSLLNSITRPSSLFDNSMITKIKEVTDKLNELTKRRTSLGLGEIISQASSSKGMKPRLQPTSVMDKNVEYVGRQNEKRELLDLLRSSNNSNGVSIFSIVGIGGLGKTTLAQLVYNDATINDSFDLKAWVCVSEDFDAAHITNTILKSIDNHSHDEKDLNLLQVRLEQKLSGKRFLLVLDDIWNDKYNDWSILRSPFGAGTKIIVTTRLLNVSSMVDPVKAFLLDKLSHDDCLSIFTQHALKARNFDEHLQFKEVGENIVRKCDGLPLAAKAIGRLLRTVKDLTAWERIHESEIWDLPESQCGIVPALRLSYHHLPPHLKRCFAYCSIIPKDYKFEVEDIILLWGAEGFLQQRDKRQIKDVGKQYFQDLVSRSFFQISNEDESRFVMHDLINDLAQLVAGEICSKQEGDKQQRLSNRTRHSSYIMSKYDTVKKFEVFDEAISLRTFLPIKMMAAYRDCYLTNSVVVDLLPMLRCLRVLSLCGYKITELRDDLFENLKHLRYLNFSDTLIKRLPDTLCTLYHLETLKLRDCKDLERLPSKMENLVNLHYLDIRGANKIKRMPSGIGKLTNLEVLSDFIIGEGEENCIGELERLSTFSGDFCPQLVSLETETERLQVDQIHPGLEYLEIRKRESLNRLPQVLYACTFLTEMLIEECTGLVSFAESNFPPALERLKIRNCDSLIYLSSRADICSGLRHLCIDSCSKLSSLFLNAKLPIQLEHLEIERCPMLECIAQDFHETTDLESIIIWKAPNMKSLPQGLDKLSHLQKIEIGGCPNLVSFEDSGLPWTTTNLRVLSIRDCSNFGALPKCINNFTSLRELMVWNCSAEISFPEEDFPTNLIELAISNAPKIYSSLVERGLNRLTYLQELVIGGCSNAVSFPEQGIGMTLPPSLTRIGIGYFENVEFMSSEGFKHLTSLQELHIAYCPKLKSLPEKDMLLSLGELLIEKCPLLEEGCSRGKGSEWSKIAHIPHVQINDEQVIP